MNEDAESHSGLYQVYFSIGIHRMLRVLLSTYKTYKENK